MDFKKAFDEIRFIISNKFNILEEVVKYLHDNFNQYNWVGIYLVKGDNLVLGPWKGPSETEHTRIPIGKGICGHAATSGKTEVIPDVQADRRYLSCFVSTKSEIVVPIKKDEIIIGEIDIDSDEKDAFTEEDTVFLEKIADMLGEHI
jgi:GAF domain-containing protein